MVGRCGPTAPQDERPHRTALREMVDREMYVENMSTTPGDPAHMSLARYRSDYCLHDITLGEIKVMKELDTSLYADRRTEVGVIWQMREAEMDKRQKERDVENAKCRPVLSLTQPTQDTWVWDTSGKVRAMPRVLAEPEDWKTVRSESDEQA